MPFKTILLSFHIEEENDIEATLKSIDKIFRQELPDLDQHQKLPIKNEDFIVIYTSTEKDFFITIRYYSNGRLFTINGEILYTCQLFQANFIVERLKDKLNLILNSVDQNSKDLVEAIPPIKRDNAVPLFFPSSDGRILEYDFDEMLVNENTPFQNIKILHSPSLGNCLLLDDMQNLAEADLAYTHGLMNHNKNNYKDKEILILGGGDGALLHELLKESPKFITMIDIDEKVMIYCRQYLRGACGNTLDTFEGPNYHIIVDDCLKYMRDYIKQQRTFDVIFNDLTDIPISTREERDNIMEDNQKLWSFIKEVLQLSMQILRPGGLYLNHAIGANSKQSLEEYEKVLNNLQNIKLEISRHTRYVPSFMEDWVFYQLKKTT